MCADWENSPVDCSIVEKSARQGEPIDLLTLLPRGLFYFPNIPQIIIRDCTVITFIHLKARKAGASAKVITAAKWIFAGYYMEHGNSVDWKDMAMCQKKVWSIMGDSTSWEFSSSDYDDWIENAEKNMEKLDTKPSFHNTNVGTITAGTSKTITDSNKVFKDYPALELSI